MSFIVSRGRVQHTALRDNVELTGGNSYCSAAESVAVGDAEMNCGSKRFALEIAGELARLEKLGSDDRKSTSKQPCSTTILTALFRNYQCILLVAMVRTLSSHAEASSPLVGTEFHVTAPILPACHVSRPQDPPVHLYRQADQGSSSNHAHQTHALQIRFQGIATCHARPHT